MLSIAVLDFVENSSVREIVKGWALLLPHSPLGKSRNTTKHEQEQQKTSQEGLYKKRGNLRNRKGVGVVIATLPLRVPYSGSCGGSPLRAAVLEAQAHGLRSEHVTPLHWPAHNAHDDARYTQ